MVAKVPAPERVKKALGKGPKVSQKQKDEFAAKRKSKTAEITKRAEKYEKEYVAAEKDLLTKRRQGRYTKGQFYVEPEAKVAFVVRIKGINKVPPKARKALQLLRLRQLYNGVFVKINNATRNQLRQVTPFVTFGQLNVQTVRKLIMKRGCAKYKNQRLKINNDLIEEVLGKHGIICVEDVVNQIATAGPHFRDTANFLWPFQLSAPKGGMRRIAHHFTEGGDNGNREELMTPFVKRIM